jgi:hypothetical protein
MPSQWSQTTLDAEATTQDGSNSSPGELHSLEIRRSNPRSWMFQVLLMLKTEISSCTLSMVKFTNNGTSSMLKTGRVNQRKVNGTETMV